MAPTDDIAAVHATFDAIGLEPGDLTTRLAYLRGSVLGFRLFGMRWQAGSSRRLPSTSPTKVVAELQAVAAAGVSPAGQAPAQASNAEPPLDWDAAPAVAPAEEAEPEPDPEGGDEPTDGHHPTWERDRRAFFASLRSSGITDPYCVIAAYTEGRGVKLRPSAMTDTVRNAFLTAMTNPEAAGRFHEWAAVHGEGIIAEEKAARKAARAAAKAAKAAT